LTVRAGTDRAVEDEIVDLTIELSGTRHDSEVDVALETPPPGLAVADESRVQRVVLAAGEVRTVTVPIRCVRWGAYQLGEVAIRVRGAGGLLSAETTTSSPLPLRVYPRPEVLRRLADPAATIEAAGSRPARARGPGIEFADVRAFVPGDQLREINWRASARLNGLWVNERRPERSVDVVLLVDSFSGVLLADAVRLATSLLHAHLRNRDRVGVVSFGGITQWVRPGSGLRHQYVVVDALLATKVFESAAEKSVDTVPPRVLPANALVVAVTPLEDERILKAIVDLRTRGMDIVVVEVSPAARTDVGGDDVTTVAYRLWQLQRASTRMRIRALGVPVAEWRPGVALEAVMEEIDTWPRERARR
jgi:uncharacterized protein (DUF58 family)